MPYLGNTPDTVTKVDYYYTAANGQTVFTGADNYGVIMSLNPGFTDVYLNGVLLNLDEYTANSTHVTIAQALDTGDVVQVRGLGVTAVSNTVYNYSTVYYKNKVINGNFDFWQRGFSNTLSSGYTYVSDRWVINAVGSSVTMARSLFTAGQTDVPNEPTYYATLTTASVANSSNYAICYTPVEDVRLVAGKVMTLSFYAKANSTANLAVDYQQSFGTGGSSAVTFNSKRFSLSNTWQKFTHTALVPSISGKTIGTTPSSTLIIFWLDSGSSFGSRTENMGQQSRVIDIAQVQWEEGYKDTSYEIRPYSIELLLCQRYFYKTHQPNATITAANNGSQYIIAWELGYVNGSSDRYGVAYPFPVQMAVTPSVTFYPGRAGVPSTAGNVSVYNGNISLTPNVYPFGTPTLLTGYFDTNTSNDAVTFNFTAHAEII